jgi:CheY-like chemotaxis protein
MIHDLEGRVVAIARSGEEAAALTPRLRPDVVLMDVRLAGAIDGIDAAEAVLRVPRTAVVFVTANTDQSTLARIQRLGKVTVIAKPVLPFNLLHGIREACGLDAAATPCAAAVWQVSAPPARLRAMRPQARRPLIATPPLALPGAAVAPAQGWLLARERCAMLRDSLSARCEALSAVRLESATRRGLRLAARALRPAKNGAGRVLAAA